MSDSKSPSFVDDGLLVHRNATVYVCSADDPKAAQMGCYDVHINVGEDDRLDTIMFDNTATLYDRDTLYEAWMDAADWLYETANTLMELRNHIRSNVDEWLESEEEE